jgi:hypothetical protein
MSRAVTAHFWIASSRSSGPLRSPGPKEARDVAAVDVAWRVGGGKISCLRFAERAKAGEALESRAVADLRTG